MAVFQHPAAGIKSDRDRDKGKSRLPDIRGSAVLKALVIDEGAYRQKYIKIADVLDCCEGDDFMQWYRKVLDRIDDKKHIAIQN